MTKLVIFLIIIVTFSIADISVMLKKGLRREILPYLLLAITAGVMGAVYFLAPFRDSVIASLTKLLLIPE